MNPPGCVVRLIRKITYFHRSLLGMNLAKSRRTDMADDRKSMDERRKEMADKIISDMVLDKKDA